MIVLLCEFNGRSPLMPALADNGWGRMWASYGPAWSYDGEPWGFDNGAWSAYRKKEDLNIDQWLRRMVKAADAAPHPPCVAVVPDIVAGGVESLQFSLTMNHWCRVGWPWFLAVQDGMCAADVRPHLNRFAGLFLGGSNGFKRQAGEWCKLAHDNGLRFHFGRCNREPWIEDAIRIGADSIDTSRPVRCAVGGQGGYF